SRSASYFGPARTEGPLTATAGPYRYSPSPVFPQYGGGNNYWVDVVFDTDLPENTLPTVSLATPSEGSVFTAPGTIEFTASASDADGTISLVEYFSGTEKIGEATSSPYGFTWGNVQAGEYAITARATDNDGGVGVSA